MHQPRVFCAVLLAATIAQAQPDALAWDAPEGCPTAGEVERDVERLLGRPVPYRATGRVRVSGGKWVLALRIGGDGSAAERTVEGETCQEVAIAAATIIALALDPKTEPVEKPPTVPRDEGAAATPRPARADEPGEATPPARRDEPTLFRVVAGAFGAMDARALPDVAPGVGVDLGLAMRSLRVDLTAAHFPQQRAVLGRARADISLSLLGLRVCGLHRARRLQAGVCAVLEAGVLNAESSNITAPAAERGRWWAAGLGLRTGWQLMPRLSLVFGGDALVPLARDEFVIEGHGIIHRTPDLTGRGVLGIESTLW